MIFFIKRPFFNGFFYVPHFRINIDEIRTAEDNHLPIKNKIGIETLFLHAVSL